MSRARSCKAFRWGIMNHVGGVWGPETFDTEDQARAYLDSMQRGAFKSCDLSRHRVMEVRVTVSPVIRSKTHD